MTLSATFDYSEVLKWAADLNALGEQLLPLALQNAATEAALFFEREAKLEAPFDTGRLKASIGHECVLAANTVILEGREIPPRSVVAGVPGVVKKTLEGSAADWIAGGGSHYVSLSRGYLEQGIGEGEA